MKSYLLVGGAGFIGSNLAHGITEGEECRLLVADNLSLGSVRNIEQLLKDGKVSFTKADFSRKEEASQVFQSSAPFDTVFHLAANSDIRKSSLDPALEIADTFMTTINVLENMVKYSCKELVFCSSSAVYGDRGGELLSESSGPFFPISFYGAAKLSSEAFISSFSYINDIKATILRFPNVVGDNATHGVIFEFVKRLRQDPTKLMVLGDGRQSKPYIYVKDLVGAVLHLWKRAPDRISLFNVGVDTKTDVDTIAQIVCEEMGLKNVRIEYTGGRSGWKGDVPSFSFDLSRIHRTGWTAAKTSDEAVRLGAKRIIQQWTQ